MRALEVFPQPRGPLNKYAWCVRPDSRAFESGTVTCSCPMTSANTEGRYLRYKANDTVCSPCSSLRSFKGPLAHPPERTYPCCIPALGEFSTVTPYEGSGVIIVIHTDRVLPLGRIRIAAECARLESVNRATYRGFKSLILRTTGNFGCLYLEGSHSGRVRASRTRVDESLEGSNPSSSASITSSVDNQEGLLGVFVILAA